VEKFSQKGRPVSNWPAFFYYSVKTFIALKNAPFGRIEPKNTQNTRLTNKSLLFCTKKK
jgi:hypothetical protein